MTRSLPFVNAMYL